MEMHGGLDEALWRHGRDRNIVQMVEERLGGEEAESWVCFEVQQSNRWYQEQVAESRVPHGTPSALTHAPH